MLDIETNTTCNLHCNNRPITPAPSGLVAIETAVRALLEPPNLPWWAPAPPPEPLAPDLAALLPALAPGPWQVDLRLALALRRNPLLRQVYIRNALKAGGLPSLLERMALAEGESWPALRLRLLAAAWGAGSIQSEPLGLEQRVALSLAAAVAYLDPAARLPAEAWDVPRLSQPPEVGEGVVFPAAIIAEALLVAGTDPWRLARLIIDRRSTLGWSYWNPKYLPPDSGTLGQVLQVLARVLEPGGMRRLTHRYAGRAAAQVAGDGSVPVLLADGHTWTLAPTANLWPVEKCPMAAANLFTGLWLTDPALYGTVVERGARWLLADRTPGWEGPSYLPPYGRYVVCRFLALLAGEPADPPYPLPTSLVQQIRERLLEEREAAEAAQLWDGSWGSPQATALNLSTLLTLGGTGSDLDAAALFLTESQQVTGCWRSEPLWLTPGPGVYPATHYESVPVTTALCLRALALWQGHRLT